MLMVTATNLPRLMACNGSRLMGGFTPPVRDDTIRNEGNAADWVIQQVHSGQFTIEELGDRKAPNGVYITDTMIEYLEEYLRIASYGQIEVNTSHGTKIWEINGRADLVEYRETAKQLFISDFKYGWGIVEPENNWTLISHAISWIAKNPDKLVETIIFTIYQPRPHHQISRVREWSITVEQLDDLYKQLNETLSNPSDAINTGPHCYKCPSLASCPASRLAQMNAVDASEMAFDDNLDNDELSFKLDHMKRAIEVLTQAQKAYIEIALDRVRSGQVIKNYSITNDLTNTVWKEYVTPEMIMTMTGKDVTKKALITPNQAKKAGVSEEVVKSFTERRNKGVKLERIDANAKAEKMFSPTKKRKS